LMNRALNKRIQAEWRAYGCLQSRQDQFTFV
jgi:hypothetical protein